MKAKLTSVIITLVFVVSFWVCLPRLQGNHHYEKANLECAYCGVSIYGDGTLKQSSDGQYFIEVKDTPILVPNNGELHGCLNEAVQFSGLAVRSAFSGNVEIIDDLFISELAALGANTCAIPAKSIRPS